MRHKVHAGPGGDVIVSTATECSAHIGRSRWWPGSTKRSRTWCWLWHSAADAVEPPTSNRDDPNTAGRSLDLQVIDRETKQPVSGMTIAAKSFRMGQKDFDGKTDDRGHCIIPVAPNAIRTGFFEVLASKDGTVPVRVYWCDVAETTGIPDAYL